jgi:hypothetical protein
MGLKTCPRVEPTKKLRNASFETKQSEKNMVAHDRNPSNSAISRHVVHWGSSVEHFRTRHISQIQEYGHQADHRHGSERDPRTKPPLFEPVRKLPRYRTSPAARPTGTRPTDRGWPRPPRARARQRGLTTAESQADREHRERGATDRLPPNAIAASSGPMGPRLAAAGRAARRTAATLPLCHGSASPPRLIAPSPRQEQPPCQHLAQPPIPPHRAQRKG